MTKPKRPPMKLPLLDLTDEQQQTVIDGVTNFRGDGTTMESALGALIFGKLHGWRALKMMHSPSTYKKYEKILGLSFQDICPERTPHSDRMIGIAITDKVLGFWDVVMGRKKVENKGHLAD